VTKRLACCLVLASCAGRDLDQSWNLHEARTSPAAVHVDDADAEAGDFVVTVPLGVARDAITLAARESLTIGERARIVELDRTSGVPRFGLVSAAGALRMGADSEAGSVYSLGPTSPTFDRGVWLHGYLRAAASVDREGWRADQGALDRAPDGLEEFVWHIDFPRDATRERVSHDGDESDLAVAPGAYDSLTAEPGSTMVLSAGAYVLRSLTVKPDADLIVDNTNGPVYIWVRDRLSLEGNVVDLSMRPTLLFGYAGKEAPRLASRFRGTLVAPNSRVTLPATSEPHGGAFFARDIVVAEGAVIEHRTFVFEPSEGPPPAAVCGACIVGQAFAVRACADERARALRQGRRAPGQYEACVERATEGVSDCEHRSSYRTGACWHLGYALELHSR
jgi:hypothetical protein